MFQKIQGSKAASVLCGSLLVAACGGGGGSSSGGDGGEGGTGETLQAGVFFTTVEFDDGSFSEGATFLSPTGRFVSLFDTTDITFGALEFASGRISGGGTDYVFFDSWDSVDGSVSGTVLSPVTASLTATAPGYSSQVSLERENTLSDSGVSLSVVSGTYMMNEPDLISVSVTIDSDGTITGSDDTGCAFNGALTIPDTEINVFEVTYTASNCPDGEDGTAAERNGEFSGLGAYDFEGASLLFAGRNGNIAVVFAGSR